MRNFLFFGSVFSPNFGWFYTQSLSNAVPMRIRIRNTDCDHLKICCRTVAELISYCDSDYGSGCMQLLRKKKLRTLNLILYICLKISAEKNKFTSILWQIFKKWCVQNTEPPGLRLATQVTDTTIKMLPVSVPVPALRRAGTVEPIFCLQTVSVLTFYRWMPSNMH
jgi:hypothetical protein